MMSADRESTLRAIAAAVGTPVYVYDAEVIRTQLQLLQCFDIVRYAQKACSNTAILRLLRDNGALVDCVSEGELVRALAAGFQPGRDPAEIVYTADILTASAIDRIIKLNIPVNAGSTSMLSQIGSLSPSHPIWLRINPGFGHGHNKKVNTGGESSKHGIWHTDLSLALNEIDAYSLDLIGIHMHIGSGADFKHLSMVCNAMVEQVIAVKRDIRAISVGGGLPIPYRYSEEPIDITKYFALWSEARQRIESHLGHPIQLELEPGRYLVGQSGVLLAEVRAVKRMGSNYFTLVDAGFNDLVRPAMYGSYHEISLLSQIGIKANEQLRSTVVAGPLCESGDVFTQLANQDVDSRLLPAAEIGDLLVFHDAGAYGASMGSNYNSRPLPPEVLIDGDEIHIIRRRQTIEDLLSLEQPLKKLSLKNHIK